jgi:hypothetical protein
MIRRVSISHIKIFLNFDAENKYLLQKENSKDVIAHPSCFPNFISNKLIISVKKAKSF